MQRAWAMRVVTYLWACRAQAEPRSRGISLLAWEREPPGRAAAGYFPYDFLASFFSFLFGFTALLIPPLLPLPGPTAAPQLFLSAGYEVTSRIICSRLAPRLPEGTHRGQMTQYDLIKPRTMNTSNTTEQPRPTYTVVARARDHVSLGAAGAAVSRHGDAGWSCSPRKVQTGNRQR
eukprot:scaffold90244_cov51-Phaeocystis_antarctica.AAC.2